MKMVLVADTCISLSANCLRGTLSSLRRQ